MEQPAPRQGLEAHHKTLLNTWRHAMNLVGPGAIQQHFDDAKHAANDLNPEGEWADLGTGAGFPGMVWAALFPGLRIDLVDSRLKRCTFLQEVLDRAGQPEGVRVLKTRVEDLPDHAYDGLTGRAFAPPDRLFDHAYRLLRAHGRLVMFLQGGTEPPADDRFALESCSSYSIMGRARQVAFYRLRDR